MATANLSPVYNGQQFFDNSGKPLAGGYISTYVAGSFTSMATTYTDAGASLANPNPVQLDSSGRAPDAFWLVSGRSYNMVVTDKNDIVLENVDNVQGLTLVAGPSYLRDLNDVHLDTLYSGQVLKYDGYNWVNANASGGGAPTWVATLTGIGTANFGGNLQNQWSVQVNQFSGQVLVTSAYGGIQVQEYGFYEVEIQGTIIPTSGSWPTNLVMVGCYINQAEAYAQKSTHTVYSTSFPNGVSNLPNPSGPSLNQIVFRDKFIVNGFPGCDITPNLFASMYSGSGTNCNMICHMQVTKTSGA